MYPVNFLSALTFFKFKFWWINYGICEKI